MGKVRILSDIVVSKIAAGEIVERPASVIKELIENSIDARSSQIRIELRSGGKRFIKIEDDGEGMTRDDALLSIERHATSKIKSIGDLLLVDTLGFRGEALPSIASVSKFKLTTKAKNQLIGVQIFVNGGVVKKVEEYGCPEGTTIEIKDLFYNTLPRRKFLKTTETELRNVIDVVQRHALCFPNVRFELKHDGNTLFILPQRKSFDERTDEIFPDLNLFRVEGRFNETIVEGLLSSPDETRSTTQKLYICVNERPVKDRFLTRIAIESYGKLLEKGRYPQGMLMIRTSPKEIDVNVHPTKSEVRFSNPRIIASLLKDSIYEMLRTSPWLKSYRSRVRNAVKGFYERKGYYLSPANNPSTINSSHDCDEVTDMGQENSSLSNFAELSSEHKYNKAGDVSLSELIKKDGFFSGLKIIGQLGELYLLCASDTGMIIIDQHAAHERVNYERLLSSISNSYDIRKQRLLMPITIELSPEHSYLLKKKKKTIDSIGIEIEEFGDRTFLIRSLPSLFRNIDVKSVLIDTLCEISDSGNEKSLTQCIENIVATMACHSSVRASDKLNYEQMRALLRELDLTEFPHSCPHGRPVAREITFRELEKMFKRA